jgi:hypothetical protein
VTVRPIAWCAGVLSGLAPGVALACPVCFAARDKATQLAFLGTTILLTSLPVLMIGGVVVWVARRSREIDAASRPKRPVKSRPARREDVEPAASAQPQPMKHGA